MPVMIWQERSLLMALIGREFRNRYNGSLAGVLWAFIHPLILLSLYALVFGLIFQVRIPQLPSDTPYVVFIAVVLWPWLAFQEAITRGTMAVQNHASLVKKVAFNHELLVYSSTLVSFIIHGLGYSLVLLALALSGYNLQYKAALMVVIYMLLMWMLATSIALVLAAFQVFVRDVEQGLSQALALLFYATPILYPLSMLPENLRLWLAWNPLAYLTEPIRQQWLLMDAGQMVGGLWSTVLIELTLCAILWWCGRQVFHRLSPYFEDAL